MKVLIDFHLSDYWADPGTQSKPKAWENLSYDELKTTLYNYMKNTLNDFKNQGVVPDMVQVGNETSSGILWDEGKTILFVSHDMGSVIKYCERCLLINKGKQVMVGKSSEAVDVYKKILANQYDDETKEEEETEESAEQTD